MVKNAEIIPVEAGNPRMKLETPYPFWPHPSPPALRAQGACQISHCAVCMASQTSGWVCHMPLRATLVAWCCELFVGRVCANGSTGTRLGLDWDSTGTQLGLNSGKRQQLLHVVYFLNAHDHPSRHYQYSSWYSIVTERGFTISWVQLWICSSLSFTIFACWFLQHEFKLTCVQSYLLYLWFKASQTYSTETYAHITSCSHCHFW